MSALKIPTPASTQTGR